MIRARPVVNIPLTHVNTHPTIRFHDESIRIVLTALLIFPVNAVSRIPSGLKRAIRLVVIPLTVVNAPPATIIPPEVTTSAFTLPLIFHVKKRPVKIRPVYVNFAIRVIAKAPPVVNAPPI